MDFWKLQKIRGSVLHDLAEFVPIDHYKDTVYGIEQGKADYNLGKLFFKTNPAMTARQVSACEVLIFVGLYGATDGVLAATQTAREILNHENPDPEAVHNQPLRCLKSFELDLYQALKEYAKYLPDNEAKPLLSYIEDDLAQTPAAMVEANGITTQQQAETVGDAGAGSQECKDGQQRPGINGKRDLDAADWYKTKKPEEVEKMTVKQIETELKARDTNNRDKLWHHGFSDWNRTQLVYPKKKPGRKPGK